MNKSIESVLLFCLVSIAVVVAPALGQEENFCYFPTASETDGRMISFSNRATSTFSQVAEIQILHIGGSTSCPELTYPDPMQPDVQLGPECLDFGIFDGDSSNGSGHWDQNYSAVQPSDGELKFDLYWDPAGDGSGLGSPIGTWYGNNGGPAPNTFAAGDGSWVVSGQAPDGSMPDNDWFNWEIRIDPDLADLHDGDYDGISRLRMVVGLADPSYAQSLVSNLKPAFPSPTSQEPRGFRVRGRGENAQRSRHSLSPRGACRRGSQSPALSRGGHHLRWGLGLQLHRSAGFQVGDDLRRRFRSGSWFGYHHVLHTIVRPGASRGTLQWLALL